MVRALAGVALSTALAGALLTAPATADEPVIREWWDYQQIPSLGGIPTSVNLSENAAFVVARAASDGPAAVHSATDLAGAAPAQPATWTRTLVPDTLANTPAQAYAVAGGHDLLLTTADWADNDPAVTLTAGLVTAGDSTLESVPTLAVDVPTDWKPMMGDWTAAATADHLFAIVPLREFKWTGDLAMTLPVAQFDRASGAWSTPVDLLAATGAPSYGHPQVRAMNAHGSHIAVAWTYYDYMPVDDVPVDERGKIHLARSDDAGTTWTYLERLGPGTPEGREYRSVDNFYLAWLDDELRIAWEVRSGSPGTPYQRDLVTVVHTTGSGWAAPESFAQKNYGSGLGTLSGRWALLRPLGVLLVHDGSGWTQVGEAQPVVHAMVGDHVMASDRIYSVDTTAPTISGHEPIFPSPGYGASSFAKDTGGIRLQTCRVDGHDVALNDYGRCAGTPTANGPHTMVHEAVDIAGHTSSRTYNWVTDGIPPVVKWKSYPGRWARSTSATWWWYASDAHSGLESFDVRLNGSGPRGSLVDSRTTRPGYSRSAYLAVPEGQTICAKVTPTDRAHLIGRTIGPSCSTAPLDDRRLWHRAKRIKRLTGSSYFRDTVTSLTEIGSQLSYDSTNFVIDVAVLARKCPTCGTIRIAGRDRSWTVNLRSSSTGVRAIEVPLYGELNPGRVTVTKVGYGSVLIDGLYLRAEVVY
ncbi:MAG: hypothetical protein ACRDO1_09730 [Nocardioidaceae bacterium]